MNKGKILLNDFEQMKEKAELNALSRASLEQPLTNEQYDRFMELGRKFGLVN